MMRRTWLWFGLALLALALAEPLPSKAPFTRTVTLEAGRALPLEGALRLIAQAAGVPLLLGQVPEVTVKGRIQGPFREVLDLLVRVYGQGQVDYVLVSGTVVVGPKEALLALRPSPTPKTPVQGDLKYLGFSQGPGGAYGVFALDGKVVLKAPGEKVGNLQLRGLFPDRAELVSEGEVTVVPLFGGVE